MDNKIIKYIDDALWFKTIDHYPKTLGHIKLLVSIIDKIGICNNFDLNFICEMDGDRLNIFYAVLRIMNKIFNKYTDYATKILINEFQEIFTSVSDTTYYQLLMDQLTQDIDHFICNTIKNYYPDLDDEIIETKFIEYLKFTFQKTFYQNMTRKMEYNIYNIFNKEYKLIFLKIIKIFVNFSRNYLKKSYKSMTSVLNKIFSINTKKYQIDNIIEILTNNISLEKLFNDDCLEISIYSEQKLDDELESSDEIFQTKSFNKISNLMLEV